MTLVIQAFLCLLAAGGLLGAIFKERRMTRLICLAFLALGVVGLLSLEAIGVGRELVRSVGDAVVTVELRY